MTIATGKPPYPKVWNSGLYDRVRKRLFRCQRYVDGEDAASARHIADADLATVCQYSVPSDRESQAKARPVGASAVPEHLKQIALALWNPATLVFRLDE